MFGMLLLSSSLIATPQKYAFEAIPSLSSVFYYGGYPELIDQLNTALYHFARLPRKVQIDLQVKFLSSLRAESQAPFDAQRRVISDDLGRFRIIEMIKGGKVFPNPLKDIPALNFDHSTKKFYFNPSLNDSKGAFSDFHLDGPYYRPTIRELPRIKRLARSGYFVLDGHSIAAPCREH